MKVRILTKNGVDNTNIDGARGHNFNAGRRSGIVKGALNGGNFFASNNNTIALDTCELRLCGHRIVLDDIEYRTFTNKPSVPVRYSFVARVVVDDNDNVSFEFVSQEATTPLVQDNLDINGSGTYELEIGKFTQLTDGNITDVVRTADLITGGADNDSDYIRIGTVTTNKISPELDADVDIENTINPTDNKPQTNFTFNLPTAVGTVVSLNGEEQTSMNTDLVPTANSTNLVTSGGVAQQLTLVRSSLTNVINTQNSAKPAVAFAESERQKSKNLFNALDVKIVGALSYNENTNTFTYTINEPLSSGETSFEIIPFGYLAAGTYTVSFQSTTSVVDSEDGNTLYLIGKLNQDGNYDNQITQSIQLAGYNTITFTLTERLNVGMLWYYKRGWIAGDTPAGTKTLTNLQLEEGSIATDYVQYHGQLSHNGDKEIEFARNEYEKSKNLIPFPYYDGNSKTHNGVTFTVNNDQSISVAGSVINHDSNAVMWLAEDLPLKAGTYRISDDGPDNTLGVVVFINNEYYQKDYNNGIFTLSSDATASIYIQVAKASTQTYNNVVRFMLCEGTDTSYQQYNGAIVHEKEIQDAEHIETIYDMSSSDANINWGYTGGIVFKSQSLLNKDFTKCKKLRFLCNWNHHGDNWFSKLVYFDVSLDKVSGDGVYHGYLSMAPCNASDNNETLSLQLFGRIEVSAQKTGLQIYGYKINVVEGTRVFLDDTTNLPYFRIERIEGVK